MNNVNKFKEFPIKERVISYHVEEWSDDLKDFVNKLTILIDEQKEKLTSEEIHDILNDFSGYLDGRVGKENYNNIKDFLKWK